MMKNADMQIYRRRFSEFESLQKPSGPLAITEAIVEDLLGVHVWGA